MSFLSRLMVLALTALAAPAIAAPVEVIRIGAPDQSVGPVPSGGIAITTFLQGQQRLEQEFAKDGIKIEWNYFKGAGPAVNEALANKQLDIVYLGDLAGIIGRSSGLPTRLLVPARGSNAFLAVAPDAGITKLEDLKGKRITVFKGTAYQLALDRALAKVGLTERDAQVINLDWTAALAALAAKQLDANWAGMQALTLRDKGLATIAISSKELGPEYTIQAGLIGTEDFIAAHPDLTQRFVSVVVKTMAELTRPEQTEAYLEEISKRSGIPVALARAEFQADDLRFRFSPRFDPFILAAFQGSIDQAKALGLVRKTFDAQSWFEPRFVDQAIAEAGLGAAWPQFDAHGKAIAP